MGGLSLAAGLGSSIASSVNASRASKAAQEDYSKKTSLLDSWFNKQYYSDITQRTDVQNMLRLLQENSDRQARRDNAVAQVNGSTEEQQLAAQDKRNKTYADAVADIASNASSLKDTYLQNYLTQRLGISDPTSSIYSNLSNQWSTSADNAFKTGANLLSKYDSGGAGATGATTSTTVNINTNPKE